MENLLNLIFPLKCLFCNTLGSVFCKSCLLKCNKNVKPTCIICEKYSPHGDTHFECLHTIPLAPSSLHSCFIYEDLVRTCIRRSKYGSRQFAALKELAKEGIQNFTQTTQLKNLYSNYIIIPIPLSPKKDKERGFNQAEIIAKILSQKLNLPMQNSILNRVKNTVTQFSQNRAQRYENVKDAFAINPQKLATIAKNKFLLVDDICTSGATLIEAAKPFYQADAYDVSCFTLARRL